MLAEFLTALVQIIDLTLKRNDHRKKVDQDSLAKNLISILIDLERVEKNADKIRWYFFYMERDAASPSQVEKHKVALRNFIPTQIAALYDLNERYAKFRPLFEMYMEEHELPTNIAKHVFEAKQLYLYDLIESLDKDNENFSFTRAENTVIQLNAIRLSKQSIARLIKENIPMVDFIKWYTEPEIDYSQNELDRAKAMQLRK